MRDAVFDLAIGIGTRGKGEGRGCCFFNRAIWTWDGHMDLQLGWMSESVKQAPSRIVGLALPLTSPGPEKRSTGA